MKTFRAKLVILGPHNVGKTSVVIRYQSKIFQPLTSCTVGASFSNFEIQSDDFRVKLQVWDTAGQERFRAMTPMYYRGAHGAILMFDLTDPESLGNLKLWSDDLLALSTPGHLILLVAGNKCDMIDERRITERDGRKFAAQIGAEYFETSAKVNSGVAEIFENVGNRIGEKLFEKASLLPDDRENEEDIKITDESGLPTIQKKSSRSCCH